MSFVQCDVTDPAAVVEAMAAAETNAGAAIDVLVCAAGAAKPGYFLEQGVEVFERTMRLNYLGTVYAMKAAAERMVGRRTGHLVLISSGAAAAAFMGYGSYAPTKFAVRGLADSVRNELLGTGVRVRETGPHTRDCSCFPSCAVCTVA